MTQPLIQMQNVDKFFGSFQALKNINLEVHKENALWYVDLLDLVNLH